jgi:hypothetical protein
LLRVIAKEDGKGENGMDRKARGQGMRAEELEKKWS